MRVGRRNDPSGSTLTLVLPPTVCAVLICRVITAPLCRFKFSAKPMSQNGEDVGARHLELVRPVAESAPSPAPSGLIRLFGLVLTLSPSWRVWL